MINVKSIPLPCALVSKDGKVVQANEDAAKWLEETSVENKLWIELMPSEKTLAENWSFGEIKNKKVLLHKIKKREGFTYVLFFCGKEYTALLEEAEQLRQSNRALDAIIESSYDGIYITDNKGNTLKTNSAIERITGIPKEYYIGKILMT
ncbi:PAS domain-containing protein [Sinobaca sp. H24]|uniref:PAS domain-containing protein n=1 Tax=Sinobaca sp. H24 TaxID=2923376 RepID=UPI00207A706A|nr:PAS domain-containing protein [Sinobaca sp. H24]